MSIAKSKSEILAVALIFALLPLLYIQASHLWERPHFQFFPLAWGSVAWLIYSQGKLVPTQEHWRARIAVTMAVVAGLAGFIAVLRVSPWIAQVAAILGITAWGLQKLGEVPWSRWLAWTSLLWITIPLPLNYDTLMVQRLQTISSESAGSVLDLVGTPFLREGNLIEVKAKKLFVDEACSGVDSLYSLAAVALFIILFQKRPFVVALLSIVTVPAWAWLGNVVRLTLIAWLLDFASIDLSSGWKHTTLGIAIFAITSGCLYLTVEAISNLFYRFSPGGLPRENKQVHLAYNLVVCWPGQPPVVKSEEDKYFSDSRKNQGKPAPKLVVPDSANQTVSRNSELLDRWTVPITIGMAVLLSIFSIVRLAKNAEILAASRLPHYAESLVDSTANAESLPLSLGDASKQAFSGEQRNPDNLFGEYSRFWQYDRKGTKILLSLDFPFRGYHTLWMCYESSGYKIPSDSEVFSRRLLPHPKDWPIESFDMTDALESHSHVFFSMFTASGEPIALKGKRLSDGFTGQLAERLGRRDVATEIEPVTFQFQMLVQSGDQLSEQEKQHYLDIYLEALPYAIEQVKKLNAASEK